MNERFDIIIKVLEIVGTIAFASSGALTAIEKKFDLLGVIMVGVTTAVGGGILRDLLIGSVPVSIFRNPLYIAVAAATAAAVFLVLAVTRRRTGRLVRIYELAMLFFDTVGLGVFTITGITAAMRHGCRDNCFLLLFSGVITGVGGGLLRDIIVNKRPEIFVGNIYACASVAGAAVFLPLYSRVSFAAACAVSLAVTFLLRLASVKFDWNLPKLCLSQKQNEKQ